MNIPSNLLLSDNMVNYIRDWNTELLFSEPKWTFMTTKRTQITETMMLIINLSSTVLKL